MQDYLAVLKGVFDFPAIKALLQRSDFSMVFDAMHAVTGAYAGPIFVGELGASPDSVKQASPGLLRGIEEQLILLLLRGFV